MNLHIQKLAEQAGMNIVDDKFSTYGKFAEKFAELIVAECVGIVAKRKNQAIDDDCNVDEAMTMAEMDLLEHFGVEE
jgi:hypothetical protein